MKRANLTVVPIQEGQELVKPNLSHELNIVIGSGQEIFGFMRLFSTVLLIVTIIKFGYVKAEVSFIIILSLAIADCGHLLVVVGHMGPELLMREMAWCNLSETVILQSDLLFWYAGLGSYILMAFNRFYAICRPFKQIAIFSVRRTFIFCCITWFFCPFAISGTFHWALLPKGLRYSLGCRRTGSRK